MRGGHPQSCCVGKEAFGSWRLAAQAMRRMKRDHQSAKRARLEVYKCRFCSDFHVGSGLQKQWRRRRPQEADDERD